MLKLVVHEVSLRL